MQNKKEKVVYTKWITDGLIQRGIIPNRIENNPKKPGFFCWVFPNTTEVNLAFSIVLNQKH